MGLMFHKRFTNGHHLLRAETRLSPSTYYFGKIYQRSSILMGHLHIYSYKKEGLYLCSDIRSRGAKKYSPFFLIKCSYVTGPHQYRHTHDSFHYCSGPMSRNSTSLNWVNSPMNWSSTVPTEPLRCLRIRTSALSPFSEFSS